jgi:hypothetical protein
MVLVGNEKNMKLETSMRRTHTTNLLHTAGSSRMLWHSSQRLERTASSSCRSLGYGGPFRRLLPQFLLIYARRRSPHPKEQRSEEDGLCGLCGLWKVTKKDDSGNLFGRSRRELFKGRELGISGVLRQYYRHLRVNKSDPCHHLLI